MPEQIPHESELAWSFHTWMGFIYFVLVVALIILPAIRKRSKALDRLLSRPQSFLSARMTDGVRKALMLILTIVGVATYTYCVTCTSRASLSSGHADNIFHITAKLSMRVFPFFIIGCFIAGIIEKYFRTGRIPIPRSMIGNGLFASLIPMCACAVVPLAQSMLHLHRIPVRAVITFLMVAPVLTPLVFPLSVGVMGWDYLALRVVATFAIGMITGIFIERWAGVKEDSGGPVFSCVGCSKSSAVKPEHVGSALILGWNTTVNLLYYILIGVAIGALITVYMPPALIGKYLSNGSLGLVLAALVGIPIYICSGEEIIILAPLMDKGLPMGHAITFTITGNAICITSIALLAPAFGKRATAIMIAALFFGSIAAGGIINLAYSEFGQPEKPALEAPAPAPGATIEKPGPEPSPWKPGPDKSPTPAPGSTAEEGPSPWGTEQEPPAPQPIETAPTPSDAPAEPSAGATAP